MGWKMGLEPTTPGATNQCSNLKNKEKDNVYSKELFDEFADYVREYLFPREYKEEKKKK